MSAAQMAGLIDTILLGSGALALLVYLARLGRRGELRQPLAAVQPPERYPSLIQVFAIIVVFHLFAALVITAALRAAPPGEKTAPGSAGGMLLVLADVALRIVGVGLSLLVLGISRAGLPARLACSPTRALLAGALGAWMLTPLTLVTAEMCAQFWRSYVGAPPVHPILEALERSPWGSPEVLLLFASALVFAPVCEELFFRGVVLRFFHGITRLAWLSVLVSGLLFGLVHAQQPQTVLPLIVMGVGLGFVRLRTGSLTACVIVHALFNARTMILAALSPEAIRGE